ncbi:DUF6660 family protein [Pedobacter vanadiisoli]|uniref:DUF6660 family protein n=1 Tax=Pedobacter vanadiisoli TaxID=1761975 RepID=A0ABW5MLA8_9SPHI
MKNFVFLFSFYLILLGFMPCQDKEDMVSKSHTENIVHSNQSKTEHRYGESCPPFCSCTCCSVGQHFPSEKLTDLIVPVYRKPYPVFQCSALKKQPFDIWQPPKLV